MFNSWLVQVQEGKITQDELETLAQCLDGELDVNDLSQIGRSEGFLDSVNRIKDSAIGGLTSMGNAVQSGCKSCAQNVANTMTGAANTFSTMLTGNKGGKGAANSQDKKAGAKKDSSSRKK